MFHSSFKVKTHLVSSHFSSQFISTVKLQTFQRKKFIELNKQMHVDKNNCVQHETKTVQILNQITTQSLYKTRTSNGSDDVG